MKVEIWSDVVCPYCYIGKRRLESALQEFDHAEDIEIQWKSFQLQPDAETKPNMNVVKHLSEVKGWPIEQADQMTRHVTDMAAEEGLEYNFDQAVVANTFKAHRFIHFAQTKDKGGEAKEALLRAYFTEGRNIDDNDTLVHMAEELGLEAEETRSMLKSDKFSNAVKQDVVSAQNMNIRGVPFFLFNRKYAVSGAQQKETFLKALNKAWSEWKEEQHPV
ncbi:MAG: DsbA family oxidoreductase [Balneolaceae bacterium]|nr:DsbA family oxidoreductase [Balneolaceae bacterium]